MRIVVHRQDLSGFGFKAEEEGEMKEFQTARGALEKVKPKQPGQQEELPTGGLVPFIEAGKVDLLAPQEEKPVVMSYTNPLYRFRLEMEARGFKRWERADLGYIKQEDVEVVTETKAGGVKMRTKRVTRRAWLTPPSKEHPDQWGAQWSSQEGSVISGFFPTADKAVDKVLDFMKGQLYP